MNNEYRIDSHIRPPRQRKERKCPLNVSSAYVAYSTAYKGVFGVLPSGFTYDKATQFIHVGSNPGVSLQRLKEMTRQLRARAG